MRILKCIIVSLVLLSGFTESFVYAQSTQDALREARRRGVSTRQDALRELDKYGISYSQAEEMARMRGINLNDFLDENFNDINSNPIRDLRDEVTDSIVIDYEGLVDTQFQSLKDSIQNITSESSEVVEYFGYDIFQNNPFGSKEYILGNIDDGYLLAPGDELKITVYGQNTLDVITKIDLNGNVVIPVLGVVQTAGLSFKTLKERLTTFLGRTHNGLVATPQKSFLDVSLTQIRPVTVTILGDVITPGPHIINAFATVLNALYASGGISVSGSLREITVFRNGKKLKTIDLYDFITTGKLSSDIRLMTGDIVFVPHRKSSIRLSGEVKRNQIFELKEDETLSDLLEFSGGLLKSASLRNLNINRVKSFKDRSVENFYERELLTLNFTDPKELQNAVLFDEDQVVVRRIPDYTENEITINGSVDYPGSYSISEVSDLRGLIQKSSLKKEAYLDKVDVSRTLENGERTFKTYSLNDILTNRLNLNLQNRDSVNVYSREEVFGKKTVSISGFVSNPKVLFWREGLSLFDVIFQSTSFEELQYQSKLLKTRIDLKRYDSSTGQYKVELYDLNNIDQLSKVYLNPLDQVVVYTKSIIEEISPIVTVTGNVNNPGEYSLDEEMFVEDAILSAGGFDSYTEFFKVNLTTFDRKIDGNQYSKMREYVIDRDYIQGITKAPVNPIILKDKDIVSVSKLIRSETIPRITVVGEVFYPGTYTIESVKTNLADVLEDAGGLTSYASKESSFVLREGKTLRLKFKNALRERGNLLLTGDVINVASNLEPIETLGSVVNPSVFNYTKGKRSKHYIKMSGGKINRIEKKVVVHLNGSSQKIGLLKNPKAYPGDQIILIEKQLEQRRTILESLNNFNSILGVLTGSLTTIFLISRL